MEARWAHDAGGDCSRDAETHLNVAVDVRFHRRKGGGAEGVCVCPCPSEGAKARGAGRCETAGSIWRSLRPRFASLLCPFSPPLWRVFSPLSRLCHCSETTARHGDALKTGTRSAQASRKARAATPPSSPSGTCAKVCSRVAKKLIVLGGGGGLQEGEGEELRG